MNPGELEVLTALVNSVRPQRVVEFGCNVGRTAKVLLREVPTILEYIGVDVNPGYNFACDVQKHEVPVHPGELAKDDYRFRLMLSDRGTYDLDPKDIKNADVVFIDGDHSYEAVVYDSYMAKAAIRSGGIIIWHDYHNLETVGVRRVLEELHFGSGIEITHVQQTWLAFHRVKLAGV